MPALLESTRNYLKSSTKIGRRLSNNRESNASEGSLHDIPTNLETLKQQPQQQHQRRYSSQSRLSSLFNFEGRNRSSVSSEDRAAVNGALTRKSEAETPDQPPQQDNKKKRRSGSSQKSTQSLPATAVSHSSLQMDDALRARSPTLSASSKKTTQGSTATSMYDVQAHVWHRNLLEESIMHSLKLGYAEPSSTSRSAKRAATDRSRKAAAVDRVNSPYQMVNSSTTNITHSFTSFTLELPEDQVAQVLSSSAVPHLFKIKNSDSRLRGRRDSNASHVLHTGPSPSPRVLTGKTVTRHLEFKENMNPRHTPQVVVAAV
ncbi:hypothetical protein BGZ65_004037 [Modicella reniformis]|uniref:Uncharacterized protein n=1 Tax=Modicella reniformis TaxID=1440133 RepID=A0A9P6M934_9FUNG|nr:hypothetical protein BGZ65_004037 [Modicella reniformis]